MQIRYLALLAPLISTAFFMLGSGYLNTFISLRMSEVGHSEQAIGMVASAYHIGVVIGSLKIAELIIRIGRMRASACFVALFNLSCLMHALNDSVYLWFFLRLLAGISLAGIYITIESWLLECSSNKTRGVILSIYMIVFSTAQASGQLLLDIYNNNGVLPFVVVVVFISISVIPICLSKDKVSKMHSLELVPLPTLIKLNPSGIFACFASGLIMSAIYSLLPIILKEAGKPEDVAFLMFITLIGGMILQYPIGVISDNFDRRKVIIGITAVVVAIASFIIIIGQENLTLNQLIVIYFLLGGMSFTIYPVALSMVCDYLRSANVVSVSQALTMVDGVGSIVGPIIAPPFMYFLGANGLFVYFAIIASSLLVFLIYRIIIRKRAGIIHTQFVASPHTTPIISELDPRGEDIS